jgi:TfoX/Sxy family transcriptional regulator of competence genes
MASDVEFVQYVADQIKVDMPVTYKKMFGDYLIYVNGKPSVLVCDNSAFIKKHACLTSYLQDAELGFPYEGAKEQYIIDVDDSALLTAVVTELEKHTPVPKKKG